KGDDKLGSILMASYLRLLGEREDKPKSIIFWNTGVNLVCEGSQVLKHIQKLESAGVEILACTTCLEYFDLIDKLIGENRIDWWGYDIHYSIAGDNLPAQEMITIAESMSNIAPHSGSWIQES
ncbi:hypothetical protein ACFLYR_05720, partial [Chloroflexota bacterium]